MEKERKPSPAKAPAVSSKADDGQRRRKGKKESASAKGPRLSSAERPTADKEKIKQKLKECEKLKEEHLAGWQRERADFLNYKKEELARIEELLKYADTGFTLKLLPILDNFEITEKKLPKEFKKDENIKGLLQIKNQIKDLLKSRGIEEIECLGNKFDPSLHEIVEAIEMKGGEPGTIIEEAQKGYKIHGKVLRPARVKVIKQ